MKSMKKLVVVLFAVMIILTSFAACGKTTEKLIIGTWKDSTGMMGYEFKEDGTCVITYADVMIPIVNIKYTGKANGSYSLTQLEDDSWNVKLNYTIYTKTFTSEYKVSIDKNALSLTDIADGETVVYYKTEAVPAESTTLADAPVDTTAA